ncbi:MAG: hypothetical protein QI223_04745 [Candidatus Korarchaeota archaeon]|nr:hypothetical protein [Candidatus Korarchaeota archaeon]
MRFPGTSPHLELKFVVLIFLLSTAIVCQALADSRESGEVEPLSIPVVNCKRYEGTYS